MPQPKLTGAHWVCCHEGENLLETSPALRPSENRRREEGDDPRAASPPLVHSPTCLAFPPAMRNAQRLVEHHPRRRSGSEAKWGEAARVARGVCSNVGLDELQQTACILGRVPMEILGPRAGAYKQT